MCHRSAPKWAQHRIIFENSTAYEKLERVMGIEPTLFAWEARVLPLNDTRSAADYRHGQRGQNAPA